MLKLGITKVDVVNIALALVGFILSITGNNMGIMIISNFGGLLMLIAVFIAMYQWWRKTEKAIKRREEKKK